MSSSFTIYFDGTVWVGVIEIADRSDVRAARHVFGPEPGAAELWDFVCHGADALIDEAWSAPSVAAGTRLTRPPNPKRAARAAARDQRTGPTAAQRALAAAQTENARARIQHTAEQRRAQTVHRRACAVARRRAKHRGH